jgi:phospholipid/cholesterol/gamma-HCH transport system substrate-binding protein
MDELQATAREAAEVTRNVRRSSERSLQDVSAIAADLARTTPQLPAIARNLEAGSAALPQMLVQAEQTAQELERLLAQLRGHWLLGGGGAAAGPAAVRRLPAEAVRP